MMGLVQTHKKEKQKPRLQVALDFETLDDALAISKEVAPSTTYTFFSISIILH